MTAKGRPGVDSRPPSVYVASVELTTKLGRPVVTDAEAEAFRRIAMDEGRTGVAQMRALIRAEIQRRAETRGLTLDEALRRAGEYAASRDG